MPEDDLRKDLRKETEKWLSRAIEKLNKIKACDSGEGGEDFLNNIKAYIEDSKWFLERGDLIRAFECIIWAWAWIEIGVDTGHLIEVD
ncbi:MAG: DUF357 domain-containing protein [Archaeoglobus sp.]|nr:MAG: DUF357 domain-containing protein [Archaeoglobus sp.]